MALNLAMIGFGEAAQAFAPVATRTARLRAFDVKTSHPATQAAKHAEYAALGVLAADTAAEAVGQADVVLSLVTADAALAAAQACARHLKQGALWCDLNSVAPDTKRAAAMAIQSAGGRYADVAAMSPVHPARMAVPLLVSGPHADAALAMLAEIGFTSIRVVPGAVGRASSIKMIRSVIVKGTEALTAECVLAADAADVLDEVLESLDATPPPPTWRQRAGYNLERMMVHGLRRAAEMDEVVKTLDALGTGSAMSRATASRQLDLAGVAGGMREATLDARLLTLRDARRKDAA